jgi:hypothetical protein
MLQVPAATDLLSTIPLTPEVRGAYRLLLLTSISLVAIFSLTILLLRVLRRYRQTYMRSPRKPTPSSDVWRQHRLPPDWEKKIEPGDENAKDEHKQE